MNRFLLFIIISILVSCKDYETEQSEAKKISQEAYNKLLTQQAKTSIVRHDTLDSADRKKIPYLKDFLAIYPESTISYLSFAETDFPGLSVNTTLYDRYQFNMRVPVKYSDDNTSIVNYGPPICHLLEIKSVDSREDGHGGVELGGTSGRDLQKHFGEKDWQTLFNANGDFSVLGYELKQHAPVNNFILVVEDLKKSARNTQQKCRTK